MTIIIKYSIISHFTKYTGSCKVFNGADFKVSVVPSNIINPEEQIKKGISSYDLGNCTNVIKEYYNISNIENLIILNIETINEQKNENNNNDHNSYKLGKNTKLEISIYVNMYFIIIENS